MQAVEDDDFIVLSSITLLKPEECSSFEVKFYVSGRHGVFVIQFDSQEDAVKWRDLLAGEHDHVIETSRPAWLLFQGII